MGNARTTTAERGWQILRSTPGVLSRDDLNRALAIEGLEKISARMWDHYRKLQRYGIDHYVPINELDVMVKLRRSA